MVIYYVALTQTLTHYTILFIMSDVEESVIEHKRDNQAIKHSRDLANQLDRPDSPNNFTIDLRSVLRKKCHQIAMININM